MNAWFGHWKSITSFVHTALYHSAAVSIKGFVWIDIDFYVDAALFNSKNTEKTILKETE